MAGIIRRHRKAIGSTWRRLNPAQQALLVLVYLRKGETFTELSAGFGVSVATAWRYVEETVALLRARAAKVDRALRQAIRDGLHYLVLDGMLIPIDRVRADRPYYSAKHRMHGMNVQVIAAPDGTIIWTSGSLPGSTHDLTAARIWGHPASADAGRRPDPGRQGVPRRRRPGGLTQGQVVKVSGRLASALWRSARRCRCLVLSCG
ncbi:hypothetical protein HD593_004975 [Nonomuraea rubra]|uniref:DDE superfamily endonuclease n=1 Tax=Nonomuraea rubra TaxID=46180 RepID=A0A7X0NV60_9ACTN|nr:hypothetical protein [Nonomuraea rubra]